MIRTVFFIDGFNLYHALDYVPSYRKYKWLDFSKMAQAYIRRQTETVSEILFFTALATWNNDKVKRHKILINAQENAGIQTIYGNFKKRPVHCRTCQTSYVTHEEKQTDVNIATWLLKYAALDKFDRAYIVSGDNDLIPPIQAVKDISMKKEVGFIIPIGRNCTAELQQKADFTIRMKEHHLAPNLFPNQITLPNGNILTRPATWI